MTHRQLYGLAALLWLIAGVNVLRIGLVNWPSETNTLVSILFLRRLHLPPCREA